MLANYVVDDIAGGGGQNQCGRAVQEHQADSHKKHHSLRTE